MCPECAFCEVGKCVIRRGVMACADSNGYRHAVVVYRNSEFGAVMFSGGFLDIVHCVWTSCPFVSDLHCEGSVNDRHKQCFNQFERSYPSDDDSAHTSEAGRYSVAIKWWEHYRRKEPCIWSDRPRPNL